MNKVVNIYACGGGAINIALQLEPYRNKGVLGFADFNIIYVDTSVSNITAELPFKNFFHVTNGNTDGSGKLGFSNYSIIEEQCGEILFKHKPSEFNIVLNTAAGGSGAVIGPVITSTLLESKIPVISVVVGSRDSRIDVNNTINTLKSYEVISSMRECPVVAAYYENNKENSQKQTDAEVINLLVILSSILSGDNARLDSADLKNWLDYTKVTSFPSRLSFLSVFSGDIKINKGESLISVVTLVDDVNNSAVNIPVEYQTVGIVPESNKKALNLTFPVNAAIIGGAFHTLIESLNKVLLEYDAIRKSNNDKSLVTENTKATKMGLVF